ADFKKWVHQGDWAAVDRGQINVEWVRWMGDDAPGDDQFHAGISCEKRPRRKRSSDGGQHDCYEKPQTNCVPHTIAIVPLTLSALVADPSVPAAAPKFMLVSVGAKT